MEKQKAQVEVYGRKTIETSFFAAFLYNQNIGKHTHVFFEFTYCVSGEMTNVVNGEEIQTPALESIVLIKPGDVHEIRKSTPSSDIPEYHRDIYCLKEKMKSVCDFLSPGLYEELLHKEDPIVIPAPKDTILELENSLNFFNNGGLYSEKVRAEQDRHHTATIVRLMDLYLLSKRQKSAAYPHWIEEFLQSLSKEEVLREGISELIQSMNYSRGHICREFKKYVGKTMIECLNEARIAYSTILLSDSSLSISEVASRLNFSSQGAYTNSFKKIYGVSPKQWRKIHL